MRRSRLLLAGAVLVVVIAAAAGAFLLLDAAASGSAAFPPPPPDPPTPVLADFAGAGACAECHADKHAAWRASTHGRAGGDPGDVDLLRPFDGRPIRFRDADVLPVRRGGGVAFVVRRHEGPTDTLVVDGVVGGGHMVGGGTQGFVTRWADGSLRFLPFELTSDGDRWFCNTTTRLDEGDWLPITPDMRLADCGDWPPLRALGEQPRLATCQNCHGSQIDVSHQPGQARATRLAGLAIDCESCHGPALAHIEAARSGATGDSLRIRSLATLGEDASNDVCFSCHALKDALRPEYHAGARLTSFYSLLLPLLSDAPVYADGRIRTFAYQQQQLWSDCYLSGTMTCTDCHAPHDQSYRDVNGRALEGRFDDAQCTACHASKAVRPELHTKHAPDSEGSRCVSCHMPYLQEPEVGDAIRYARSDHTIPVPRPASDAALGIEVACAQCHADVDADALEAQVRERWGELKPRRPIVQTLLDGGPAPDRATLLRALEEDGGDHGAATFMALGLLLRDHLRPNAGIDATLHERLDSIARSPDPDLAAVALAALHWTAGDEEDVRARLVSALEAKRAQHGDVRRRWVVLLGFLGDRAREAGDPATAIVAYDKALELAPQEAGVLANLGLAHMDGGDAARAIDAYRRSIAADSMRALTHVNLGVALAALGDAAGAERAYGDALRIDPHEPIAAFNLGNLYLRAGRAADAAAAYRTAVDADPALAAAWFNLARASVALEDLEGAANAIENGLIFEPGNAAARQFLEELRAR